MEGSGSAHISTLTTDPAGDTLLSGGGDRLVKLWGYDEGMVRVLPWWGAHAGRRCETMCLQLTAVGVGPACGVIRTS